MVDIWLKVIIHTLINTDWSDHVIYHLVQNKYLKHKGDVLTKHMFSSENELNFNYLFEQTDFSSILNIRSPAKRHFLQSTFDSFLLLKQTHCNKTFIKEDPCTTQDVLTSMRTHSKLCYNKLKQSIEHNTERHRYKTSWNLEMKITTS